VQIPTLRQETCKRKVALFRSMVAKKDLLSETERRQLVDEMRAFADSLQVGNAVLWGAGAGLGASVLPVVGTLWGPLIGGSVCAIKSQRLSSYRKEAADMIIEMSN